MPRFTSRSWGSKCGICSQPGHTKPWCTSLNPQAQVIVCVSTLHKFPAEWHCEACRGDTLVHQEACHSDGPRKCHEEEVKSPSEREQKSAIGNECSEIPDASKKIGSPSGKPAARLLSRDFVPARCTKVGLPLVQQYLFQFEQLVREHLPKVGEHFSQEMINPSMYASQWFITVFSYSFPFNLALRIWDVFLYEGVQIVFQVGLALLKYCHDNLIKLPFEKLIHALRNFPDEAMDPDILLPMAYSVKVSKRLEELKKEYEKKNGKAVQPAGSSKEQLQDVKQK